MSDFSRLTHPILNQAGRDWYYGLGKRKSHFPSEENAAHPGGLMACAHNDQWFDRTLCAEPCGNMHTWCTDCGDRLDDCLHETAPAAPDTALAVLAELVGMHDDGTSNPQVWATAWARARALVDGQGEETT